MSRSCRPASMGDTSLSTLLLYVVLQPLNSDVFYLPPLHGDLGPQAFAPAESQPCHLLDV